MKSEQTTFDTFLKHAKQSQGPSYDPENSKCLYRGPNGRKCLIGEEIRDEDYLEMFEGQPANSGEVRELMVTYGHNPELCQEIQSVHDMLISTEMEADKWTVEKWQDTLLKGMEEVAENFKLKFKL